MIKEIEKIIRDFDYPDLLTPDVHERWPADLAMQITKAVASEIDRIVVEALR